MKTTLLALLIIFICQTKVLARIVLPKCNICPCNVTVIDSPLLVDEYGKEPLGREKARLNNYAVVLQGDTNLYAVMFISIGSESRAYINKRIAFVHKHLTNSGVSQDRIFFVITGGESFKVRLFALQAKVEESLCESGCELIKGVDVTTLRPAKKRTRRPRR